MFVLPLIFVPFVISFPAGPDRLLDHDQLLDDRPGNHDPTNDPGAAGGDGRRRNRRRNRLLNLRKRRSGVSWRALGRGSRSFSVVGQRRPSLTRRVQAVGEAPRPLPAASWTALASLELRSWRPSLSAALRRCAGCRAPELRRGGALAMPDLRGRSRLGGLAEDVEVAVLGARAVAHVEDRSGSWRRRLRAPSGPRRLCGPSRRSGRRSLQQRRGELGEGREAAYGRR